MDDSPASDPVVTPSGANLRHRVDAVSRLLGGGDPVELAAELNVTPKTLEAWAKEFCRAGENRLRQLPDNAVERWLTAVEKLVPLATLVSVLLAGVLFVQGQRKAAATDRQARVRDVYTTLDDRYLEYVKLCLDHPDLDVFDTPLVRAGPPTVAQKREESMVFAYLMSVLERAYLMYSEPSDGFERNQWNAWSSYMAAWSSRANFRSEWGQNRTQFDPNFAKYLDTLIASPQP